MRTLEATQSLFEIETANKVGTLEGNPISRRVSALTTHEAETKEYAIRTGDVTLDVTPKNVAKRWLVWIETARKEGSDPYLTQQCDASKRRWRICAIRAWVGCFSPT